MHRHVLAETVSVYVQTVTLGLPAKNKYVQIIVVTRWTEEVAIGTTDDVCALKVGPDRRATLGKCFCGYL